MGNVRNTVSIRVRVEKPDQTEKEITFNKTRVIIGRPGGELAEDIDLWEDNLVSRNHASLYYELNAWWVKDLGSRRGTILVHDGLETSLTAQSAYQIMSGDQIKVGNSRITVDFHLVTDNKIQEPASPGTVLANFTPDEFTPPPQVPVVNHLRTFNEINDAVQSSSDDPIRLLDSFMGVLRRAFPQADRFTILLVEDQEKNLVPRLFYPQDRAHISLTIARRVVRGKNAVLWSRQLAPKEQVTVTDATYALYAPMICRGEVLGVLHLDVTQPGKFLRDSDLEFLSTIATSMAQPLGITGRVAAMPRLPSVFVGYDRSDQPFVEKLSRELRKQKIKVWYDDGTNVSDDWRDELVKTIHATDAFIFVGSPRSVSSPEVKRQLGSAQNKQKRIFPVLCEEAGLPESISNLRYLPMDTEDSFQRHIDALVTQINNI